ncbi:hypothetical protein D3C87_2003920 [compost metagenome]
MLVMLLQRLAHEHILHRFPLKDRNIGTKFLLQLRVDDCRHPAISRNNTLTLVRQ